jgi:Mn-dependent DtxR family transcriptional regulator
MKVTVALSDQEMAEALQQRRRARIAERFLSGVWGVDLEGFEADQERDRQRDAALAP